MDRWFGLDEKQLLYILREAVPVQYSVLGVPPLKTTLYSWKMKKVSLKNEKVSLTKTKGVINMNFNWEGRGRGEGYGEGKGGLNMIAIAVNAKFWQYKDSRM